MLIRLLSKKAQSTFEYAVLISIVVAAIVAMHTYMRRAVQGRLKQVELDLNQERNK